MRGTGVRLALGAGVGIAVCDAAIFPVTGSEYRNTAAVRHRKATNVSARTFTSTADRYLFMMDDRKGSQILLSKLFYAEITGENVTFITSR